MGGFRGGHRVVGKEARGLFVRAGQDVQVLGGGQGAAVIVEAF